MNKNIIIIGAGPSARDVLDIFEAVNSEKSTYNILGFVVEKEFYKPNFEINGYKLLGDFDFFNTIEEKFDVIVAFGKPELRAELVLKAINLNLSFTNVIHPRVIIGKNFEIGIGNAISAGTIISNNVKLSNHIQINFNCTIGHDTIIENFVTLSPGVHISGNNFISEGAFLGVGSNTLEKLIMGKWSVLAAGSALYKDLGDYQTAIGVPAKSILKKESI